EYESRIKDVDTEIAKLVEGIRADAEADKARILKAAADQAAQMKKEAELRIAAEIELARSALTKEVALAATNATERLLKDTTISASWCRRSSPASKRAPRPHNRSDADGVRKPGPALREGDLRSRRRAGKPRQARVRRSLARDRDEDLQGARLGADQPRDPALR